MKKIFVLLTIILMACMVSAGNVIVKNGEVISDDATVDGGTIAVDTVNNYVGIGTASPSDTLHVTQPSGNVRMRIGQTGAAADANGLIEWDDTNNQLQMYVSGESAGDGLNVANGGNVGIGTTSPNSKLTIYSDTQTSPPEQFVTANFTTSGYAAGMSLRNSADSRLQLYQYTTGSGASSFAGFSDLSDLSVIRSTGSSGLSVSTSSTTDLVLGTNNAERLRISGTNGNVGIGTSNPLEKLHIDSGSSGTVLWGNASSATYAEIDLMDSSNTLSRIRSNDGNLSFFVDNSNQALNIMGNGDVGIGTVGPSQKLSVNGNVNITGVMMTTQAGYFYDNNGGSGLGVLYNNGAAGENKIAMRANGADILTADGATGNVGIGRTAPSTILHVEEADNTEIISLTVTGNQQWDFAGRSGSGVIDYFDLETSGNQLLTVSDTGQLGVGATVPSEELHVNSSGETTIKIQSTGTDTDALLLFETEGNGRGIYLDDDDGNSLKFYSGTGKGAREEIAFDNTGNIIMGTGTTGPARKLVINGGNGNGSYIDFQGSGLSKWNMGRHSSGTINDDFVIDESFNPTNPDFIIKQSGNIGMGVSAPDEKLDVQGDIEVGTGTTGCVKDEDGTVIAGTCSSDIRLKDNIKEMESVINDFRMLKPSEFTWKGENKTRYGFIAQEVESVFPELVEEGGDGYKRVKYDSEYLMYLTKAVIEQQEQIETMQGLLEKQQEQINQLMNK